MNAFEGIQFSLLHRRYKLPSNHLLEPERRSLSRCFGEDFPSKVKDKIVVDFGCGHGSDTFQMAHWNAGLAIGLEIRKDLLESNRSRNTFPNCEFYTHLPTKYRERADMVISVDAFEHFDEPEFMLEIMYSTLRPGGEAYINFGPTWYHPYGGHLFSVFPWAHLLLSERALVKWRNQYFNDGATRFTEVAGGLNKMSISGFEKMLQRSRFEVVTLECTPLRNKKWLQRILGREFTTGAVGAVLRRPLTIVTDQKLS